MITEKPEAKVPDTKRDGFLGTSSGAYFAEDFLLK